MFCGGGGQLPAEVVPVRQGGKILLNGRKMLPNKREPIVSQKYPTSDVDDDVAHRQRRCCSIDDCIQLPWLQDAELSLQEVSPSGGLSLNIFEMAIRSTTNRTTSTSAKTNKNSMKCKIAEKKRPSAPLPTRDGKPLLESSAMVTNRYDFRPELVRLNADPTVSTTLGNVCPSKRLAFVIARIDVTSQTRSEAVLRTTGTRSMRPLDRVPDGVALAGR